MKREILDFADTLVSKHALDAETAERVNIHSQERGGTGPRGYGTNRHGLEIAWWIHPGRVHQELEFLLDHVPFRGNEQLLSIACGPSFHESTLAKFFPALQVVATDFDPKEVETGRRIAGEVGVAS